MKFRIKIEIDNSGRKKFIPQAKEKWYEFWWCNIVYSEEDNHILILTLHKRSEFETANGADKIIKELMKQEEIKKSKKVNNLKYINYD